MARNLNNFKKILGMKLEEAGSEGVVPSNVLNRAYVDFDGVRAYLTDQTKKGKLVCIKEGDPINLGTYVLKKYYEKDIK